MIVDAGYAKVNDDKKNEFDPSTWWKEPTTPEWEKEKQMGDMPELKAATNATNASSINNTRISNALKEIAEKKAVTGGRVTVVDTAKSSIMQRDSKTGRVSIGYRA